MSKTFSNAGGNRDIRVIDNSDRGFVIRALDHIGARSIAITFNNDTAPALALAILEAAYGSDQPAATKIGEAWAALYAHIAEQERITAEAKAQAELEAEALGLFNAYDNVPQKMIEPPLESFEGMPRYVKDRWLAVARRAREMRAEK